MCQSLSAAVTRDPLENVSDVSVTFCCCH